MTLVVAMISGFLASRLLWIMLRDFYDQPLFLRRNYRGREVPTGGGFVLVTAVLLIEAGRAVAGSFGIGERTGLSAHRSAVIIVVLGFGLVGLLDDMAGNPAISGFRGHLKSLASGQLTTGAIKILGGGFLALLASFQLRSVFVGMNFVEYLRDAAIIALAANTSNLFDKVPGRALKVSALGFIGLVIATSASAYLAPTAVVVGAALALMLDDLHERVMLGDSGSNIVGASIGVGIIFACSSSTRWTLLLVLLFLNVLSEFLSFSRIIAAIPPLRGLDQIGRHKSRRVASSGEELHEEV